MKLGDLDGYFGRLLDVEPASRFDSALNGLQLGRADMELRRLAFAVDACLESLRRAKSDGADLLFVHHGIFWGRDQAIVGPAYQRISFMMHNDLALYACHLPLDVHPELGHNALMAKAMGLRELRPFGLSHGLQVGLQGRLPEALGLSELAQCLLPGGEEALAILPYGPQSIRRVAIVSGDGGRQLDEAIASAVDVYVTGEVSHVMVHKAREAGLSLLCLGHYASETWGLRALAERCSRDTGLPCAFIDLPTGL